MTARKVTDEARKVTDEDGRTWDCKPEDASSSPGKDVSLMCTTPGMPSPLRLIVSWQWMKMPRRDCASHRRRPRRRYPRNRK